MKSRAIEFMLTAAAGLCALAFPVVTGTARRGYAAPFLPFMRDVVEGVQGSSLLLLLLVGFLAGRFGEAPVVQLGIAAVVTLPLWSIADMALGGDHNLLPIEWFIYGIYGVVAALGAAFGRARKRRTSTCAASVRS